MSRRFIIIGAGTGQAANLTETARQALMDAACVFAAPRLAEQLGGLREIKPATMSQMVEWSIACTQSPVALLVSGDSGFFSLTKSIQHQLMAHGSVEILPGLSSMQYLCAKCGQSYDDAYILSLHGRSGSILGAVSYHKKVFALTGGTHTVQSICQDLVNAGLGHLLVYVGEDLGAAQERISAGTAQELALQSYSDLAVLLVLNPNAADCQKALRDRDFVRGEVPMTKQEVRWTAVNLLDLQKNDIVYDIGAGTGSVSIEMARHACQGLVYAIERKDAGLSLIEQNRLALGAGNVIPVSGYAPEALEGLPTPDAVFIGGSGGELPEILAVLKQRNPHVRVCISAIALETMSCALESLKKLEFSNIEVCQISAARGRQVASYTMMTANNPVFLISGGGKP